MIQELGHYQKESMYIINIGVGPLLRRNSSSSKMLSRVKSVAYSGQNTWGTNRTHILMSN